MKIIEHTVVLCCYRKQIVSSGGTKYIGTQLGLAVVGSGLSPDEGLRVFSELHRARQCFVLENELHILYQVCTVGYRIDFMSSTLRI